MGLGDHVMQFIIAHRLTTVEYASKVLFLEDSKHYIVGTKEEVLEQSPAFRRMWQTHFKDLDKDPELV